MRRKILMTALAGAAIVASAPALAKPGGGNGHGNAGATVGGRIGGGGAAGATVGSDISVGSSISTRGNSSAMGQGAGRGHLSTGSAIDMRGSTAARTRTTTNAGTAIGARTAGSLGAQLTGVTNGMTVVDNNGATVGTVTGIQTVGNGRIRSVQVTLTDGQIITLATNGLSIDSGQLVTNSLTTNVRSQGAAHANINGLIHASPNSALARAGVTSLTGLTTGLTVNNSGGTLLGTVDSIVTNRSGAVVGINVDLDAGGTVFVPATTLRMDGTTVVTTFVPHG